MLEYLTPQELAQEAWEALRQAPPETRGRWIDLPQATPLLPKTLWPGRKRLSGDLALAPRPFDFPGLGNGVGWQHEASRVP